MNEINYILIYEHHGTNKCEICDDLSILMFTILNLKNIHRDDKNFTYEVYKAKDITESINDLDKKFIRGSEVNGT